MLRLACVVLPVLPPLFLPQAWLPLLLQQAWPLLLLLLALLLLLFWPQLVLPPLPVLLALLLGFFWLLPSSSLLNEHMGNCAIDRTANIGVDLNSMQVFFTLYEGKAT